MVDSTSWQTTYPNRYYVKFDKTAKTPVPCEVYDAAVTSSSVLGPVDGLTPITEDQFNNAPKTNPAWDGSKIISYTPAGSTQSSDEIIPSIAVKDAEGNFHQFKHNATTDRVLDPKGRTIAVVDDFGPEIASIQQTLSTLSNYDTTADVQSKLDALKQQLETQESGDVSSIKTQLSSFITDTQNKLSADSTSLSQLQDSLTKAQSQESSDNAKLLSQIQAAQASIAQQQQTLDTINKTLPTLDTIADVSSQIDAVKTLITQDLTGYLSLKGGSMTGPISSNGGIVPSFVGGKSNRTPVAEKMINQNLTDGQSVTFPTPLPTDGEITVTVTAVSGGYVPLAYGVKPGTVTNTGFTFYEGKVYTPLSGDASEPTLYNVDIISA